MGRYDVPGNRQPQPPAFTTPGLVRAKERLEQVLQQLLRSTWAVIRNIYLKTAIGGRH
jgi:hypothetical protein